MVLIFWALIAFFCSSIPWAMVLGFFFLNRDIREIGDHNPGGVNAWKMGGWKIGLSAVILDFEKAIVCGATHVRLGTVLFGARTK